MKLEFKTGEVMNVEKIVSVVLNVLFVYTGTDYYLINRHALVGKYGIDDVTEDE